MENKITIGLIEPIKIITENEIIELLARIDTGATKSSIDKTLADKLNLKITDKKIIIKNAEGKSTRPLININIEFANRKITNEFTVANRKHMKFPILIGRDILRQGFLINPNKNEAKK